MPPAFLHRCRLGIAPSRLEEVVDLFGRCAGRSDFGSLRFRNRFATIIETRHRRFGWGSDTCGLGRFGEERMSGFGITREYELFGTGFDG